MKQWRSVQTMVGLLSLASTVAGAQWTQTTALSDGWGAHSLAYESGFLYQAGGLSSINGFFDGTNVFYAQVQNDGTLGAWKQTTSLPESVFYHAGVAANGYLYVLGGEHFNHDNQQFWFSDIVYYAKVNPDGTAGGWQTGPPLPRPNYYFGAAVWNGTIYVTGGYDGGDHLTNGVYSAKIQSDGSLSGWATQTPLPVPGGVYCHSSVANGMLYVLGGVSGDGTQLENRVYYSKINADGSLAGWHETTPLPRAVANHAAVAAAGRVFTTGGWDGLTAFSDVYVGLVNGDGTLAAWSTGPPLPHALYQHAMAVTGTHVYLSGGFGDEVRNDVYFLALPAPPVAPTLTAHGLGTNGSVELKLASDTNTGFGFQASTNLTDWERIGWGFTGTNGLLFFQDTNAASFPHRFYRATWPLP